MAAKSPSSAPTSGQGQRKRGLAPSSKHTNASASLKTSDNKSSKAHTRKRKTSGPSSDDSASPPSKRPTRQSEEGGVASSTARGVDTAADQPETMDQPNGIRRNPKRKAAGDAQAATSTQLPRDDLLGEALEPLTKKDIRQWGGWCELESEPVGGAAITAVTFV